MSRLEKKINWIVKASPWLKNFIFIFQRALIYVKNFIICVIFTKIYNWVEITNDFSDQNMVSKSISRVFYTLKFLVFQLQHHSFEISLRNFKKFLSRSWSDHLLKWGQSFQKLEISLAKFYLSLIYYISLSEVIFYRVKLNRFMTNFFSKFERSWFFFF